MVLFSNSNHKTQIGLEFIAYIGISMVLFLMIGIASLSHLKQAQQEQLTSAVQDFALSLQYQLVVLSSLDTGIELIITLPNKINNKYAYDLLLTSTTLTIQAETEEVSLTVPTTTGSFQSGYNKVKKNGGVLEITQ